jgi:hypothetical protein
VVKVANSYWPGLFHTYEHPEIPPSTNSLERFFGSSKRSLRSITGCSSTAGGKMESCGEFLIGAQDLTRTIPKTELDQLLYDVSDADFASSKRQLNELREPARERRSIRRRLQDFLARTLREWRGQAARRPP